MPTIDVEQQRRDARRAYLNFLSLKRSSRQLGDRGNLAVASSAVGWRQWRGAGPVGGDYISRKREFSCLAAGLRLKVRKGHSDEFEHPSVAGTRNGSGRGRLHATRGLFGLPIPSIGYEWTTESRPI